jgi:hypothetical protein
VNSPPLSAYHLASHCWLVSEAKQGWSWFRSLDGRPDAAESVVGGPVGDTLPSGLKIESQCPRAVKGTLPCSGCGLSDGMLNRRPDSLWSRIGVFTQVGDIH